MEAGALKKTLGYSILAVVLGLSFILVPLIAVAETSTQSGLTLPESLHRSFKELEGSPSDTPRPSESDVEFLAVSFIIAVIAYAFFRRRTPNRRYSYVGSYPF